MSALEQSFTEIRERHDFTVLSVSQNARQSERARYSVDVHWEGYSRRGIPCNSGFGATIQAALNEAIENANRDRTPPPVEEPGFADEPLPVEG